MDRSWRVRIERRGCHGLLFLIPSAHHLRSIPLYLCLSLPPPPPQQQQQQQNNNKVQGLYNKKMNRRRRRIRKRKKRIVSASLSSFWSSSSLLWWSLVAARFIHLLAEHAILRSSSWRPSSSLREGEEGLWLVCVLFSDCDTLQRISTIFPSIAARRFLASSLLLSLPPSARSARISAERISFGYCNALVAVTKPPTRTLTLLFFSLFSFYHLLVFLAATEFLSTVLCAQCSLDLADTSWFTLWLRTVRGWCY